MRCANFNLSFSFNQIPILFFFFFLIISCFDISGDYILVSGLSSATSYGGSWESGPRSFLSYVGLIGFLLSTLMLLARSNNFFRFSPQYYSYYTLLLFVALSSSFLVSLVNNSSHFISAALEFVSLGFPAIFVLFLFQLPINYSCLLLCRLTLLVFFVTFALKFFIGLVISKTLFGEVVFKLSSLIVPFFTSSLFLPISPPFVFKHIFFFLSCFFVLIGTGQRGYLLATVISSFIFLVYQTFDSKFSRTLHFLHSFWLLLSCIVSLLFFPKLLESFNDIGTSYRLEQVSALYQTFLQKPYLGIGLGQPPFLWDSFLEVYKSFQMELDLPYQFVKFGIFHSILYLLSLIFLFLYASQVRSSILRSVGGYSLDCRLSLDYFALRPEIFTICILVVSLFQTANSSLLINFFILFFYFYQTVIYRTLGRSHIPQ
jgi:hypothetical protein